VRQYLRLRRESAIGECCSCRVTPNGLIRENIQTDLLGNALTRVVPNEGVIQIIATADFFSCDPTHVFNLAHGITTWTTHVEDEVGGVFPITVTQNIPSTALTSDELNILQSDCSFAQRLGSGSGVCHCNAEADK
jgi:hypothetical protein